MSVKDSVAQKAGKIKKFHFS